MSIPLNMRTRTASMRISRCGGHEHIGFRSQGFREVYGFRGFRVEGF